MQDRPWLEQSLEMSQVLFMNNIISRRRSSFDEMKEKVESMDVDTVLGRFKRRIKV